MKKAIAIILALGITFSYGCAKSGSSSGKIEGSTPAVNTGSSGTGSNTGTTTTPANTAEDISNPFFKNKVSQIKFKGEILFNDDIQKDVNLNIKEVAQLKAGKLYELKLDAIEGVPDTRLNLGYFYVQKDKIIRIRATQENLNKLKNEELPEGIVIVCQEAELKDALKKEEKGFHYFITVNGNKREFHSYSNVVETGFYEDFTWEKDKGLIGYTSGYGAGRDSIDLKLASN